MIDGGVIPKTRDRFGRDTPNRLTPGLAAGEVRFGLLNGNIDPAQVPRDWVLSRRAGEQRLLDPLSKPARQGFDDLLGAVPPDAGRRSTGPDLRLSVAHIGP